MASALVDSALDLIGIRGRKFTRIVVLAGLVACFAAVTGCGGDDEDASTTPTASPPAETAATDTTPDETETQAAEQPAPAQTAPPAETSPESMPGGAGDEEPARTLALLTGKGGDITPRLVRVPAFISVNIELRSADGARYSLRFGDVTLRAGGRLSSAATTIDGLRPGRSVVGRPPGGGSPVRIEATAEPGP